MSKEELAEQRIQELQAVTPTGGQLTSGPWLCEIGEEEGSRALELMQYLYEVMPSREATDFPGDLEAEPENSLSLQVQRPNGTTARLWFTYFNTGVVELPEGSFETSAEDDEILREFLSDLSCDRLAQLLGDEQAQPVGTGARILEQEYDLTDEQAAEALDMLRHLLEVRHDREPAPRPVVYRAPSSVWMLLGFRYPSGASVSLMVDTEQNGIDLEGYTFQGTEEEVASILQFVDDVTGQADEANAE